MALEENYNILSVSNIVYYDMFSSNPVICIIVLPQPTFYNDNV